jgi:hypothetical protein
MPCQQQSIGTRLGYLIGMTRLSEIPREDQEHYMKCSVCDDYFDMRDLAEVVHHQHWPEPAEVRFSHAVKKGKESEVYIKIKRRMITLREQKK